MHVMQYSRCVQETHCCRRSGVTYPCFRLGCRLFRNSDRTLSPFCTCFRKVRNSKIAREVFHDSNILVWQIQLIPIKKSYTHSQLPRLWIPPRYDEKRGGIGLGSCQRTPALVLSSSCGCGACLSFLCFAVNLKLHAHRPHRGLAVYSCCKPPTNFPAFDGKRLLAQQLHTPRLLRRGGPAGVVAPSE